MPQESLDFRVGGWLEIVRISQLSEWDVLMFLHRHGTSLVSAHHIAPLLGQDSASVSNVLDRLEALGLVQPSRSYRGVRFYCFARLANFPHRESLEQLLALSTERNGRLIVARTLREREHSRGFAKHATG